MIRFTPYPLSRALTSLANQLTNLNPRSQTDSKIAEIYGNKAFQVDPPKVLSKEEFVKKDCLSFENFQKNHSFRAKQKGITVKKAYSNYTTAMYFNYLNSLEGPDRGSISS